MAKRYEIDMTTGSIPKKVLQFAVPMILSSILNILFHTADTVIVGRFVGSEAMAAVGSNGALISLLTALFSSISTGTSVLCARYYGSREYDKLSSCTHTSVIIGIVLGLIVGILGYFTSVPMLQAMNTDASVLPLASLYLKIYFLSAPGSMVRSFTSPILTALGDTKRPTRISILSGAVNIVLNLFFVVVLHWDVAGVAIATVLSVYLALFLTLRCLVTANGPQKLQWNRLRLDPHEAWDILRIGLPSGLNNTVFNFANVTIQSAVNSLGPIAMAANAAAASVESFIFGASSAFSNAATPFASQNLGAKKYERIPRVFTTCLWMACTGAVVMGVGVRLLGTPLLKLFVSADDPNRTEIITNGLVRLTWMSLPIFICTMMDVSAGIMRGLGRCWTPLIVSILGTCALRVLWVEFVFPLNPSLQRLYLCFPLSWIVTFVVTTALLLPMLKKLKQKTAALA